MKHNTSKRFWITLLVGVGNSFLFKVLIYNQFQNHSIIYDLIFTIGITFLIWYGNGYIDYLFAQKYHWIKDLKKRLPLQLLTTIVFSASSIYFLIKAYDYFLNCSFNEENDVMKYSVTIGILLSLLITISEFGTHFFMEWKKSLVEVERFKTESTQAQLANLKNQINPHFLFNNLSVLTGLVYKDQDKSADFIQQMSKVYRYILENRNTELILLQDELQFLYSYNYLLQIRFEDSLQIQININEQAKTKYIPPMCLQMLVENAIKHNEVSTEKPLHISIDANEQYVIVSNQLQIRTEHEASTKSGLKNIEARFAFFTDQKMLIEQHQHSFTVSLPLLHTS
jgi:two-component system, LytTR family, sensor kinase